MMNTMTTFYPLPLLSHSAWMGKFITKAREAYRSGMTPGAIHDVLSISDPGYEQNSNERKMNLLVGAILGIVDGDDSKFFAGLNESQMSRQQVISAALRMSDPGAISHLESERPNWKISVLRASGKYAESFSDIDEIEGYINDRGYLPHPKDGNEGRWLWVSMQMLMTSGSNLEIAQYARDIFPGVVEPRQEVAHLAKEVRELCLFATAFDREPSTSSFSEKERLLARRIKSLMREVSSMSEASSEALASHYPALSLRMMAGRTVSENPAYHDGIVELAAWIEKSLRYPRRNPEDAEESRLSHRLDNLRRRRDMTPSRLDSLRVANELLKEIGMEI